MRQRGLQDGTEWLAGEALGTRRELSTLSFRPALCNIYRVGHHRPRPAMLLGPDVMVIQSSPAKADDPGFDPSACIQIRVFESSPAI